MPCGAAVGLDAGGRESIGMIFAPRSPYFILQKKAKIPTKNSDVQHFLFGNGDEGAGNSKADLKLAGALA